MQQFAMDKISFVIPIYGEEAVLGALRARLDAVTMDADLQDPPEVALEMIARWREGYHVVLAQRAARSGESLFKRASASLFYRGLRQLSSVDLPLDVGDFRLLDRCVVDAIRALTGFQADARASIAQTNASLKIGQLNLRA